MNNIHDDNVGNTITSRLLFKQLLPYIILAVVVILAAVALSFWQTVQKEAVQTSEEKTINYVSEEEKLQDGEDMIAFYAEESVPVATGESTSFGTNITTEKPEGHFVFSAKRKPFSEPMHIFTLDVSNSESEPQVYNTYLEDNSMAEFTDVLNPEDFFFFGSFSDGRRDGSLGIFKFDVQTGTTQSYTSMKGNSVRNLEWSENVQLLAFSRLQADTNSKSVDKLSLDNWEVIVTNPDTDTVVLTLSGATKPRWSPDGSKLLIFRTDGLYVYDISSETETQAIAISEGGKITGTSMFDVSPDGTYLAWTTAKRGTITIYEITDWEDFTLTELGRVTVPDTEFYWPQFSPDGNFYAVQAIDTLKEGDYVRKNGRIEIRPTMGIDVVYTYSLEDFAFNILFTDNWIPRFTE